MQIYHDILAEYIQADLGIFVNLGKQIESIIINIQIKYLLVFDCFLLWSQLLI